jgi:ribose 5-phosphate isomerase A
MSGESPSLKKLAAERAVEFVEPGMIVGLGSGSTTLYAVRRIGELLREGALTDIVGVPTSESTAAEARRLRIPLTTLESSPVIDLTIDGADEVAPNFDLIKGGGGALLREKIVAQASEREIIVVDETKLSPVLGTKWAVPVEVIPFGWIPEGNFLASLGADVKLRQAAGGEPFVTDHGNWILDAGFGPIQEPAALAAKLLARAGIVEHGLFLGMATDVVVAGPDGVRCLGRSDQ